MLIGLLGDTHGRSHLAAAAVRLLAGRGVDYYIHTGDVGGGGEGAMPVLDTLAGLPAAFVWGNNDFERDALFGYAADLGLRCLGDSGTLDLGGKTLLVTHGDDLRFLQRTLDAQACDYLFTGHTHIPASRRHGRIHHINPGALYRAARRTVAVVDLTRDTVEHLDVALD